MDKQNSVACECGNNVAFEIGLKRVRSGVKGRPLRGSQRYVRTPAYCTQCGSHLHLQLGVDGNVQVIARDKARA